VILRFGDKLKWLNPSRTKITAAGLGPFLLRRPRLSELAISGIATVDDACLDQIRENVPGLNKLSINDCVGVRNVETLLHLVYGLKGLDRFDFGGIPIVDEDVEAALSRIRSDRIFFNEGLRD
jgi:hypothetical protein